MVIPPKHFLHRIYTSLLLKRTASGPYERSNRPRKSGHCERLPQTYEVKERRKQRVEMESSVQIALTE